MISLDIAKTLITKRSEKGITQGELAKFLGVSKASVSKWETGHSNPDITFLPQLASYFNISVDELLGYEPQMTSEEISKVYKGLINDSISKPFDETIDNCRDIIKKYHSCFPLIYQIGVFFLNHYMLASNDGLEQTTRFTGGSDYSLFFIYFRFQVSNDRVRQSFFI